MDSCADHEILSEGAQLISDVFVVGGVVVLVNGGGGRENPITTKMGHHRPASETSFNVSLHMLNGISLEGRLWPSIECWLGSVVNFQVIWTSIAKEPCSFVIFQGVRDPLSTPPSLDPRIISNNYRMNKSRGRGSQ